MRRLILVMIAIVAFSQANAQKLIIGERAPEIRVKEWLAQKPTESGRARLVEFFFSSSKPAVDRLAATEDIAKKFSGKLSVIVISKEAREKVVGILASSPRTYFAGLDDASKTFDSYGVQFVPFSVLIDAKGKIVWFGNSTSLTDQIISKYL